MGGEGEQEETGYKLQSIAISSSTDACRIKLAARFELPHNMQHVASVDCDWVVSSNPTVATTHCAARIKETLRLI